MLLKYTFCPSLYPLQRKISEKVRAGKCLFRMFQSISVVGTNVYSQAMMYILVILIQQLFDIHSHSESNETKPTRV